MQPTKQALKRLNEAEISTKLWNGTKKNSTVKAVFSRYRYELSVSVVHPKMAEFCGNKNVETRFIFWKGSRGVHIEIPAELHPLVEKLKAAATMSDMEAEALRDRMIQMMKEFKEEMGFSMP